MADNFLKIDPLLAKEIGLHEAIVLQRLEFLLSLKGKRNGVDKDGFHWTYQNYEDWIKKDFPYWVPRTLQRSLKKLKQKGLVISEQRKYNVLYRIDFGVYEALKTKIKTKSRVDKKSSLNDKLSSLDGQIVQSPASSESTTESTTYFYEKKSPLPKQPSPHAKGKELGDAAPLIDYSHYRVKTESPQVGAVGDILEKYLTQDELSEVMVKMGVEKNHIRQALADCLTYYDEKARKGEILLWLKKPANYSAFIKGRVLDI